MVARQGEPCLPSHGRGRAWCPPYLPEGLAIDLATGTRLTEPAFFYLGFQRHRAQPGEEPVTHAIPLRELSGVKVGLPALDSLTEAARAVVDAGLVSFEQSKQYTMHLSFNEAGTGHASDLGSDLPVVLHW